MLAKMGAVELQLRCEIFFTFKVFMEVIAKFGKNWLSSVLLKTHAFGESLSLQIKES